MFRAKTRTVTLALDGATQETPLFWMLLGNTRSYGGVANITYDALVDDGLLDVAMMRRGGAHRIVIDGARALLKRIRGSRNVLYTRAATIEIATPGLPVQIDGEPCGETPMMFAVAPGALQVIVGAGTEAAVFSPSS
jgi:diacylglycerol kinase (ATP)